MARGEQYKGSEFIRDVAVVALLLGAIAVGFELVD